MIPFLKLKDYCMLKTDDFFKGEPYKYAITDSNVLAVCHMDTVADFGKRGKVNFDKNGKVITSIALDDRLGAWMISQLFVRGIKVDVLYTNYEELGKSTAKDFQPVKDYNWIFSFDRKGIQPVLYQYDDPKLVNILYRFGYDVTYGTYSDIADLDFLGVSGINFGAGYFNEHTSECMTDLRIVDALLSQFVQFYTAMKDTRLPYTPMPVIKPVVTTWTKWSGRKSKTVSSFGAIEPEERILTGTRFDAQCFYCGLPFAEEDLTDGLCPDCKKYDSEFGGIYGTGRRSSYG